MRKETIQRVLVRAPNWIGDAVMCEPALRGLRSLFPGAALTLLAKPGIAELFAAHPAFDRTIVYEDKRAYAGLSGKWTLAGVLRRHQFDLAVLFQNAFEAALLAWLAGIPRRYGYATDGRTVLLTHPVAVPDGRSLAHQVFYYWNLIRPLGATGDPQPPALVLTEGEAQQMAARLGAAGVAPSDPVIGINPGSTYGQAKRWLPERFAEVARRLSATIERDTGRPATIMILGAKGEEELGQAIAGQIGGRTVVLSGATTIRELMAATTRCSLLITNDTGPMHIAAAFGVPVVAVFGPTDWRTTAPYGQAEGIVREPVDCAPCLLRECPIDHRCMTGVTAERVYDVSLSRLSGHLSGSTGGPNQKDQIEPIDQRAQPAQENILSGYTIFLDRDGTLNPDPGYIKSPDQLELFPGVAPALARLKQAGARLIVATNQSGIARGYLTEADLAQIHAKLRRVLDEAGAPLDGIYFCPHHPDDGCRCRKPAPGMIEQAVRDHAIDVARAYVIGDHARDVELAKRVGAKSVFVTTGHDSDRERAHLAAEGLSPDLTAASLMAAVAWILEDVQRGEPSRLMPHGVPS